MKPRIFGLLVALAACSTPPRGATGTWSARVTSRSGRIHDIVFALVARDSTLIGTISGLPTGAPVSIDSGRVRGERFWFAIQMTTDRGTPATLSFTGTITDNTLTGTIAGQDPGQRFSFTATRASASTLAGEPSNGAGRRGRAAREGGEGQPPHPAGADPTPENAERATLAAFDHHEIVGLGILSYANQDFDQFILNLIRHPDFANHVDDIAVECGNARYQLVLDRYIAGDAVPLAAVRPVWRNTTQPFCGVTTFYEDLFPLVRRINQRLPASHRLRVLACDPGVDWANVRTLTDRRAYPNRDSSIVSVMEREVLAKHRKALMIFGVRHLLHGGDNLDRATYVIMAHNGFGNGSPLRRYNDELEHRLAAWPVPSIAPLAGTWLDDLPYAYFFPGEDRPIRISTVVDAYLYLGPGDLLLNQPIPAEAVLDTAYFGELERRARTRGGQLGREAILREAARDQVFFNDSEP